MLDVQVYVNPKLAPLIVHEFNYVDPIGFEFAHLPFLMKLKCPDSECISKTPGPKLKPIIRKGRFFRKSDGQWISRYPCTSCRKNFSSATFNACYRQKKRKLNFQIELLLNSTVSQRRTAKILWINRKTVINKFRFMAHQARLRHQTWLNKIEASSIRYLQFDDLETSEHSKCKPLSVSLVVEPNSRKILGFQVSRMPAKGHLAKIALQKYGPRPDERLEGWDKLFASLKGVVHPQARWVATSESESITAPKLVYL